MFCMYYVCMYVCILLLPGGSAGMLWGEGGPNLRGSALIFLQILLLALQVH